MRAVEDWILIALFAAAALALAYGARDWAAEATAEGRKAEWAVAPNGALLPGKNP